MASTMTKTPAMTAKQLDALLKSSGYSNAKLAEKLGVCRVTIHNWRTGFSRIPKTAAMIIKTILGD